MTKPTIASLEATVAKLHQEVENRVAELDGARARIEELVQKTGDNEPWLLAAAGFVIGGIAASLLWMVL